MEIRLGEPLMRPLIPERFLFRHFFDGLALGGALAEWGLACALSAEAGMVARLGPEPVFGTAFRWIGGAAVGLAGSAVAYGYLRGYRELVVTPIDVPLRGIAAPLRLVHVSDLHLGPLADR